MDAELEDPLLQKAQELLKTVDKVLRVLRGEEKGGGRGGENAPDR